MGVTSAGFPGHSGGSTFSAMFNFFRGVGKPLAARPTRGSRSGGTCKNLSTRARRFLCEAAQRTR